MRVKLITPPAEQPLTLAGAKLWLKVTQSDDDDTINSLLTSTTNWLETFIRRALVMQTWELVLDAFPAEIRLPLGRTQAVAQITYRDLDGELQTLTGPSSEAAGDDYQEDLSDDDGGLILPPLEGSWPGTRRVPGAIRVRFTAGYGEPEDIPGQLLDAYRFRLASVYEGRGEQDVRQWEGLAEAFAHPFRLPVF